MSFTKSFLLLQNDAFLAESCTSLGLTMLRQAGLHQKGGFYAAFFMLSNGLERLMKITLIIDHMRRNQLSTPPHDTVRDFGHSLTKLFKRVRQIDVAKSSDPLAELLDGSLESDILEFLTEFANSSRYFNLDALTTNKFATDPLAHWQSILDKILNDHVPARTRKRILSQSVVLAVQSPGRLVGVVGHDLVGQPLDFERLLAIPQLHEVVAPYAVYHVIKLLRPLRATLVEVSQSVLYSSTLSHAVGAPVPDMSDFFSYVLMDRRSILTKKRWP